MKSGGMQALVAGSTILLAACHGSSSNDGTNGTYLRELAVRLDREVGGDCLDRGRYPSSLLDELESAERHESSAPDPLAMIADTGFLYIFGAEEFQEIRASFSADFLKSEDYIPFYIGDNCDIVGSDAEYFAAMYNKRLANLIRH